MTSLCSSSVTASQVGSYFVQQYYKVLLEQPEFAHQFYSGSSSMIRIDGESTEHASDIYQIHTLVQSVHFSGIDIKTINSLESWNEGIIVVVSGSVKSSSFRCWRKFVQMFFLAPQEKGYFVRNDIFHFVSEEATNLLPSPPATVHKDDFQQVYSSSQDISVVEDALEAEASEKFNSLHLQIKDQGDYYTSQICQNQQQEEDNYDSEDYEEHLSMEHHSFDRVDCYKETFYLNTMGYAQEPFYQNTSAYVQDSTQPVEKPACEPVKFTYASILKSNVKTMASVSTHAPVIKNAPTTEWHQSPEPVASYVSETTSHVTEHGLVNGEGELLSVYVKNLPTSITIPEIFQEFKHFGKIKHDGVFIKNRKDVGICFAFVEFEDISGVHKAVEASPIRLAGRQVYIEERRANSSSSSRGGRSGNGGGKGRGGHEATRGRNGGVSNGRSNGVRNH